MKEKLIARYLDTLAAYNRAIEHNADGHEIEYRRIRTSAQRQLLTDAKLVTISEHKEGLKITYVTIDGKTYTYNGNEFL